MLRAMKRWFSTDETKHLAEDVEKMLTLIADYGVRVEALQRRVDLHLHKLQMRDARESRGPAPSKAEYFRLSEEEEAILADLREGRRPGTQDPFVM